MSAGTEGPAKPEHRAKHGLTTWLEGHGARVWWEETNPWGHELFTINRAGDAGGIPDLIVEFDSATVVVEFKPGEGAGQIYDALLQLHGYWAEHIANEQTFIVEGRAVDIDGFVTASKHTPDGRLFEGDAEVLQPYANMSEGRQQCADTGILPDAEYRMTEQHTRTLWRLADKFESNIGTGTETPHIGALLSDKLDDGAGCPAVLWNRGWQNQDWVVFNDA